jgi:hypothetical protein
MSNILDKLKGLRKRADKAISKLSAVKFSTAKLSDNTSVKWDGELSKGSVLYAVDDAGNESPVPDGAYNFDGGGSCLIKDGAVESFIAPQTAEAKDDDEPVEQAQSSDKPQADADKAAGKDAVDKGKPNAKAGGAADDKTVTAEAAAAQDDDDSVSSDDVTTAIAQALAPIIAQLQQISATLTGAVTQSAEYAKEVKKTSEMAKQAQFAIAEIGEIVKILADEPAVKEVKNSAVSPVPNSQSYLERTAHMKK